MASLKPGAEAKFPVTTDVLDYKIQNPSETCGHPPTAGRSQKPQVRNWRPSPWSQLEINMVCSLSVSYSSKVTDCQLTPVLVVTSANNLDVATTVEVGE